MTEARFLKFNVLNESDSILDLPWVTSQTLFLHQCLQRHPILRTSHNHQTYLRHNYLRQRFGTCKKQGRKGRIGGINVIWCNSQALGLLSNQPCVFLSVTAEEILKQALFIEVDCLSQTPVFLYYKESTPSPTLLLRRAR